MCTSPRSRIGDYAAGYFLAHEFGHHIAKTLGWEPYLRYNIAGRELYADCLAGVFTRYALTGSRRLDNRDHWEGVWSIYDRFPNEGSPGGYPSKRDREAWYRWGYNSYDAAGRSAAVNVAFRRLSRRRRASSSW